MAIAKITKKWLLNSLISTASILFGIFLFGISYMKNFFYNGVQHFANSQILAIDTMIHEYQNKDPENYDKNLEELIKNFTKKNKMELLLLNNNKVIITSSGFNLIYNLIKEKILLQNVNDEISIGLLGKQKVMTFIHNLSTSTNTEYNAIEIMVKLDDIDTEIRLIIVILFTIMMMILTFVVISNTYFTNFIVLTIEEVSKTTKRIATGDFKIKIQKRTNDELGVLCDVINDMAEKLSINEQLKNDFISSVSHELRTPLTAIKGWAETISYDLSDKVTTQKGISIIKSEADRLTNMVEELLDFSMLQNSKIKLKMEKLAIIIEVSDIILMFEERAKKEEKSLYFSKSSEEIIIMADKNRLKQVLINIIDNALKYTENGSTIKIDIFLKCCNNIKYVAIKVVDDGCGIKKEDLTRVKTKFFKANYTKRGSGIGLAIANEIIALHNGMLNIDSSEGNGTEVEILLPIVLTEA